MLTSPAKDLILQLAISAFTSEETVIVSNKSRKNSSLVPEFFKSFIVKPLQQGIDQESEEKLKR